MRKPTKTSKGRKERARSGSRDLRPASDPRRLLRRARARLHGDGRRVSINQSRVDYCGCASRRTHREQPSCPSIRAASTTAACESAPAAQNVSQGPSISAASTTAAGGAQACEAQGDESVSINQSRVDYCGSMLKTSHPTSMLCPSIRAASTTAARARVGGRLTKQVSINQSRVDYCGGSVDHGGACVGWVSINQSRVDYCGRGSSRTCR